ncbi:hypothetical protein CV657_05180 [Borreliella burgdorferi]|uniref:Uncharacterized protein n=2 Tax=Borreliella burgdorferi TaxID=139 RepID=A0A9N7G4B9_BORBG|nr:hypothetical protein [Borreliella burgdorferi]ACL33936.1 conserved hypothetical protein [Borreliella burgdorferi 156a]ADQ44579.1 conserved hypothetical protein [Borreliella burgdorferi 297]MCR8909754.1 hypothetical protein [Borreliella burgdorferi 297]MCR8909781.1 hypothetical protein [Borreliella burgdorferi 297]PRQ94952.1 hypothetical protein CV688_05205 [Borreliella burgdorferi]
MSRSIFAEASGSYSGDILQLAKGGLEELMPYKMISRNDLRQGYYIVKKATVDHNVTATFGDHSNEIGKSSIFFKEMAYKMHVFDTVQRISLKDLMYGTITEDEVKANLELGLMKDAYHSVIFGKKNINMEGIANLKGRSKVTVETLTNGFTLYEKVALAKREAEKHMEKLDEGYHLLVPHNFSHLLLELYSEPQYVTVKEALFRDHKVVTSVFKGLKNPILYQPNPEVMFVPMLPEIFFRKFASSDGDYIHASMESAGVIHFQPQEVVEIEVTKPNG